MARFVRSRTGVGRSSCVGSAVGDTGPVRPIRAVCSSTTGRRSAFVGTMLINEVTTFGNERSYPTFTRRLCQRALRPRCEACSESRAGPRPILITRRAKRSSGTGSSWRTRRGARSMCWSGISSYSSRANLS